MGTEQNPFDEKPNENYRPESVSINVNEEHMAMVFLLDTSGSMNAPIDAGTSRRRIDALNDGMRRVKEKVCSDESTKAILDIAIIKFGSDYQVIQGFRPVEEMMDINLSADGGATNYSPAIREALSMVRDQTHYYMQWCPPKKPWIVLITDGEPTDDINEVAQTVKKRVSEGKVSFRSLAIGEGCKSDALFKFSRIVIRMDGYDFSDFANWIAKSVAVVSASVAGTAPREVNLEGNLRKDQDNR